VSHGAVSTCAAQDQHKTNTTGPQWGGAASSCAGSGGALGRGPARVSGDTRESVRRSDRLVVELDCGITVYPAREPGDVWRAVWSEGGRRRYREAVTEERLAVKLEKVVERLTADAPHMERPGART